MELKILDIKGNYTDRKIEFNEKFFGKKSYDHSIYLEIKRYLSAQRQGTHKSKERGDLSGSTRKLHRQKGTGGSRKGNIKNPIFRGGGRIFGPRPRHYFEKINKLTKNLVKKTIIGYKLKENKVKIIEDFQLKIPKTKFILKILKFLKLENKKSLMIIEKPNKNLYLSSRNLKNFKLLNINELNSYSLLNSLYIIFSENSMKKIYEILNN
ncbi:50S ribosomal protein L4 [Blattabacterium sp. (Cryptocercus punctulatus) str. Cpu]|uniref:50S ribosomal protein L4 n=1 Tax=Blattabacterium sp. (Cryptocercus punctulatus) str. Cpu TaxID=1075399 RepID=UPI00023872C8|nr:50S ribosomal protein L4 [Blattabacterium sp. (Cryptocercus punctulatus) str. Cpu]AEU09283.1 50S ribosomal protein L4 [Blattabacterium sp. (Cryptocercus punctulatus) str. Cpu]